MAYGFSLGNMQHQPMWQKLLEQLQQSGIAIDPSQTSGFAPRNIRGTNTPSQHAFGRALDVNYRANPEGLRYNLRPDTRPFDPMNITPDAEGDRPGQAAIPTELAQATAANNQMKWGGDFQGRSPDPMHFELAGGVPQAPLGGPMNVAVNGPAGGASPITTGSVAQAPQAPMGGGMPPAAGGMGFLGNLMQNPAFLEGLMMLTQGTRYQAGSGAGIAHQGLAGQRAAEELRLRREEALRHADQFKQTFGLQQSESERQARQFGQTFGLQQKADTRAEADQKLQEREAERVYQQRKRFEDEYFGPAAAPAQAPAPNPMPTPAPAPEQAPAPAPRFVAPPMLTGREEPPPQAAPAPALAPQTQAPAGRPEPMVTIGNKSFPITRARQLQMWAPAEARPAIKDAIDAAEKDAAPTNEQKNKFSNVDQAYQNITARLDNYNKIIQKQRDSITGGFQGFIQKTPDRDSAMREYNRIILELKELDNLGALSGADINLSTPLPDPSITLFPWTGQSGFNVPGGNIQERTQAAVDHVKEIIRTKRNNAGAALGKPAVDAPQSQSAAPVGPPPRIKGDKDFADLPSGAEFIDPFGKLRRKP